MQFASNIFCIGYLAYCYIFIPGTFDQQVYYVFFGTELCVLVFLIIYRCSVIDANNDRAYDANVKACVLFQLHYSAQAVKMGPAVRMHVSAGKEGLVVLLYKLVTFPRLTPLQQIETLVSTVSA